MFILSQRLTRESQGQVPHEKVPRLFVDFQITHSEKIRSFTVVGFGQDYELLINFLLIYSRET